METDPGVRRGAAIDHGADPSREMNSAGALCRLDTLARDAWSDSDVREGFTELVPGVPIPETTSR